MNAGQSPSASGVHAKRWSWVPCAKQRAGELVASIMATNTSHGAKGIVRNGTALFWLSMLIGRLDMHGQGESGLIVADIDTPLPEPMLVAKRPCL
jgi:hypothetical protein